MSSDIKKVFDDVAPYITDLEWCMTIIRDAYENGDPEGFLEEKLIECGSTRSGDIRIILNRIRKLSR